MELDAGAQAVYRAMLAEPELGVDQLAARLSLSAKEIRGHLNTLADYALLTPDAAHPLRLRPASPRVGLARALGEAEAALQRQFTHIGDLRSLMVSALEQLEARRNAVQIVHHEGIDEVRLRLEELSLRARRECVSLNPGRAHRPSAMAASKPLNQQALERGVAIKCIYQSAFVHDAGTLAYARWLTGLGGAARTLPEVAIRMIIVDCDVALIPMDENDQDAGALEVANPVLVAMLRSHFEHLWYEAEPFGEVHRREPAVEDATTRHLFRLLASGMTDEAAGRKLGLSARTVRRLMAAAMHELGADSRFQAGVEAARRGWLE